MPLLLLCKLVTTPTCRYLRNLIKILASSKWVIFRLESCTRVLVTLTHIRHWGLRGLTKHVTCHTGHTDRVFCAFQTLLQTLVRLRIQMKDDYKLLEKQGLIFIKNQTAAWWGRIRVWWGIADRAGNFVWIQNINTASVKSSIWTLYKTQFL